MIGTGWRTIARQDGLQRNTATSDIPETMGSHSGAYRAVRAFSEFHLPPVARLALVALVPDPVREEPRVTLA